MRAGAADGARGVVCVSVFVYNRELCKNGWTDRSLGQTRVALGDGRQYWGAAASPIFYQGALALYWASYSA